MKTKTSEQTKTTTQFKTTAQFKTTDEFKKMDIKTVFEFLKTSEKGLSEADVANKVKESYNITSCFGGAVEFMYRTHGGINRFMDFAELLDLDKVAEKLLECKGEV